MRPFSLLLTAGLALLCATAARAQKEVYIPNEWKNPAANVPYDLQHRSRESENFVVAWGPLVGNDPQTATDPNLRFDPQEVLDTLESIYSFYIKDLKVVDEIGNLSKYKIMITMNETWRPGLYTGWAFGGGWDMVIGGMWVAPAATKNSGWVLSHEFMHTIQYMVSVLYPGHGYMGVDHSGFFWETHANFMALQRYPELVGNTDMPRGMNMNHYYIGSARKHYASWYFLQLFKDKYGIEFINRIWKGSDPNSKEHPLQTVKRLLGLSQEGLNDLMAENALRCAKWDFSNRAQMTAAENGLGKEYFWRRYMLLDSLAPGRFAIPDRLAPQDYGTNVIRLFPKKEQGCDKEYVYLRFKGHVDAGANSGWRFGIVTVQQDGGITYSPTMKDGELLYTLPENTTETYLVVMGAPTVHHNYNLFEPGFPKLYRYPWEINIQGAVPEGYQPGFRMVNGVAGAAHANGGGFVASTASVAATAYVAPGAVVLDRAQVTGNARIEGKAMVRDDARVMDNAIVGGFAVVAGNAEVRGTAKVIEQGAAYFGTKVNGNATLKGNAVMFYANLNDNALIGGNAFTWGADNLGGSIEIGGDAEIGGTCTAGKYLQSPWLIAAPGAPARPACDGQTAHELNNDVNTAYQLFSASEMAFSKKVSCGEITGEAENMPPVVNAGVEKTITLPVNYVRLSGTFSDPDGTIETALWTKVSGPAATIINPGSADVMVRNLVEGVYVFNLRATDNNGAIASAEVKVTVLKAPDEPVVPIDNGPGTDYITNLQFWPNPGVGTVKIRYPRIAGGELLVTDARGKMLKKQQLNAGNTTEIDVSAWPAGIYHVRLFDTEGKKHFGKLVVAH